MGNYCGFGLKTKTESDSSDQESVNILQKQKKVKVVFVMGIPEKGMYISCRLGGPGSGKATQSAKIVEHFGYTYLSAGDLLRNEVKSGSENGSAIQNLMNEGKFVPSDIMVRLILKAMQETDNDKFLIDGFPRNEENLKAFEELAKIEPDFILFLDCPEEEMRRRMLSRNQGREDDNIDTIRKHLLVFQESTLPLIDYYASKGKVHKVDGARPVEDVFESVKTIFSSKEEQGA